MTNSERFESLIQEYLKQDNKYELQIKHFINFLKDRLLEEKVFNLNESHIDEFFISCCVSNIGYEPSLVSHISALKSLFDFLISKDINFKELNGYISTTGFKENLCEKLEKTYSKQILSASLINSILYKADSYIEEKIATTFKNNLQKQKFFEIMIARIYIKLSLILPLKTSQMLNLKLYNIMNNEIRHIEYNGIKIKLPNDLRKQIVLTINYAQNEFVSVYSDQDPIFAFLYSSIKKKANSSVLSSSLTKTYEELNITEMLKKKRGGKKDKYIYPAESFKITAIVNMLENGTNIVYLKKLTGLDIGTLVSDYDFDKKIELNDDVSADINNGIVSTDYFTYL